MWDNFLQSSAKIRGEFQISAQKFYLEAIRFCHNYPLQVLAGILIFTSLFFYFLGRYRAIDGSKSFNKIHKQLSNIQTRRIKLAARVRSFRSYQSMLTAMIFMSLFALAVSVTGSYYRPDYQPMLMPYGYNTWIFLGVAMVVFFATKKILEMYIKAKEKAFKELEDSRKFISENLMGDLGPELASQGAVEDAE
jgi:hypothetical protein